MIVRGSSEFYSGTKGQAEEGGLAGDLRSRLGQHRSSEQVQRGRWLCPCTPLGHPGWGLPSNASVH